MRLTYDNIIDHAKIICISYKWQHEDSPNTITWHNQNDKTLVKQFVKIMNQADEIIAHNGDRFDIPWLRTRALYHGIKSVPRGRTLDTLKKARGNFKLPSNRLNDIGRYYGLGEKVKTPDGMWQNVCFGDGSMMPEMIKYCEQDVMLLERVYLHMQNLVPNNTHVGVIQGQPKWSCPNCGSQQVVRNGTDTTRSGQQKQKMRCRGCGKAYRITTLQYSKYLECKLKGRQ